jgi:Holliday junction resolvasome RuvABC ATP-dependent DNA helicase subunit
MNKVQIDLARIVAEALNTYAKCLQGPALDQAKSIKMLELQIEQARVMGEGLTRLATRIQQNLDNDWASTEVW